MKSLPRRAGKVEDNNERESSLPSLPDEEDEIILNSDDDCEEDEGGEEDDDYEEDDEEYDEDDEELDEDDEEEGDEEGEEEEEGQEHDGEVLESNESVGLEDAEGVIPRQVVVTGAAQASITAHVEHVVEEVGQTNAIEPGLVTSPAISPHLVAFPAPAVGATSSVIALPAVFSAMPSFHPQPVGKAVVAHAADYVADIAATIRTSTASSSSNGIVASGGCHDSGVNAGLWFADFQFPSAQAERPKRSRDLHEDVEDLLKKFRRPVPRLL